MKKQIGTLLLALTLSVALLTACDSEAASTSFPGESTSSQITTSVPGEDTNAVTEQPTETGNISIEQLEKNEGHSSNSEIKDVPAQIENSPEPQIPTINPISTSQANTVAPKAFNLRDVPAYSGTAYVAVNGNVPYFDTSNLSTDSSESYSSLDALGRCGVAYASVGQDLMPTEPRGSIGMVKPSGWHTVKYDCVDGKYLYNRCHLIGYQLSGENANTSNLITGTRYLNIDGMLSFENMTADYVKETGNHVAYRVTPVFDGDNLLASGVLMEGYSVEDKGEGICFCVFAYNVQPGVEIDYATGESCLASGAAVNAGQPANTTPATSVPMTTPSTPVESTSAASVETTPEAKVQTYILNTNTKKFHYPTCSSVGQMKDSNKREYTGRREDIISQGYAACKRCNP